MAGDPNLLIQLLERRPWYSFGTQMICKELRINRKQLMQLISHSSEQINVFKFNGVEYIGLESRRIDYELDKFAGINLVEKLIEQNHY
jgi:hypothetical protein